MFSSSTDDDKAVLEHNITDIPMLHLSIVTYPIALQILPYVICKGCSDVSQVVLTIGFQPENMGLQQCVASKILVLVPEKSPNKQ